MSGNGGVHGGLDIYICLVACYDEPSSAWSVFFMVVCCCCVISGRASIPHMNMYVGNSNKTCGVRRQCRNSYLTVALITRSKR